VKKRRSKATGKRKPAVVGRPPRRPTRLRAAHKGKPAKWFAEVVRVDAGARQPTRLPSQIKVGKRFRLPGPKKDAHVAALARSIDARGGLIEPVAIDTADRLIDGECRLLAWQRSRFAGQPIPVHPISIDDLLAGEYDANAIRADFSPSELVNIKRAIEAKLGAAARERQRAGGTTRGEGRVRDVVAAIGGRGGRTIEKAEKVVEAAERDPERFGKLKDDMDRTGRVDGPFKRLQNIERGDDLRNAPPPAPMQGPYHTVVIDFPWPADLDGYRDAATRGYYPYATMAIDEIIDFCAKQIEPVLAADCAVWLWIPNFHLVRGCQLDILKWLRVEGSTILTWAKPEIGQGQRLRGASEHAILAVRGNVPVLGAEQKTWFEAPAGGKAHSAKPAKFFDIVEAVTPAPRYAYFFAGSELPQNWDGHGDRVGQDSGHGTVALAERATPRKVAELVDALRAIQHGEAISFDKKLGKQLEQPPAAASPADNVLDPGISEMFRRGPASEAAE
jgi:N6-adenosine-specific RNA methylase IME4